MELANLHHALKSRDTIGMAKGILMIRERCSPDVAFDILRRASQRENRKLAEIASRLVKQNTPQDGPGVERPCPPPAPMEPAFRHQPNRR